MATAPAPRIYGLDAIGAAAGLGGGPRLRPPPLRSGLPTRTWRRAGRAAGRRGPLPAALSPGAACRGRQGAGVQPDCRRARLREPPYGRADRQRRHAVPGRFDRQRAEPPRDRGPSPGPSGDGRCGATSTAISWPADADERAPSESLMQIEIDRLADPRQRDDLAAALTRVLAEVRLAVADWKAMRQARARRRRGPRARRYPTRKRSSWAGSRPITSPSSAIATIAMSRMRRSPAASATS